jgi:hypothetical protein
MKSIRHLAALLLVIALLAAPSSAVPESSSKHLNFSYGLSYRDMDCTAM